MIVTCPNCAAKYQIASAAIGERGRMVSCANCRHRWFVDPEHEKAHPPADPPPASLQVSPPERARVGDGTGVVRRGSKSTLLGWVVCLAVIAALAGLVLARDRVATMWPQIAGAYRLVGLSVNIDPGLEIRGVTSSETEENGQRILIVTGEVVNNEDYAKTVPPLHVAVLDNDRNELASETLSIDPAILEARATVRFEKRIVDVPTEARHTAVRFEGAS